MGLFSYDSDARSVSHSLSTQVSQSDEVEGLIDEILQNKGQGVMFQLYHLLGETTFFHCLKSLFT